MVDDENREEKELNRLRVMALKSIIETVHDKTGAENWDPEIYEEHKVRIQRLQDELVELGAAEAVVKLSIDYATEKDISREIKLLGIALLFGGNKKAQRMFLTAFRKDEKNLFLKLVFDQFSAHFLELEKIMKEVNMYGQMVEVTVFNEQNMLSTSKDSHREYVMEEMISEAAEHMDELKLTLRLLQLLCEGHNLALQEYLCLQDNTTFNQVNFIQLISEFYNAYYKFINQECIEVG